MRRSLALGAVWVVAAALAAGVAWAGIGVVGDQVTDDRPAPLSADEVAQAVAAGEDQQADTTTASTTPPTTAASPADASASTETYQMTGGVVTLRFSPTGAEVVGATPHEGFEVDWEPEHGNGVKVEFESDGHESRLDAWWDGGPRVERREDGEEVVDDDSRGPGSGDDDGGDDGGNSGPG
ncbi:MAG TPA: hypothetical protein VE623_14115 [Acidimicrobiales bacterium]|nr:hypothetical protein [Acidimicrobiales bacterium]